MLQLEASWVGMGRTHWVLRSIIFRTLEGIVLLTAWSTVGFGTWFVIETQTSGASLETIPRIVKGFDTTPC